MPLINRTSAYIKKGWTEIDLDYSGTSQAIVFKPTSITPSNAKVINNIKWSSTYAIRETDDFFCENGATANYYCSNPNTPAGQFSVSINSTYGQVTLTIISGDGFWDRDNYRYILVK